MPRLPRLNSREAIRASETLAFEQVRQRGSHFVLQRGPVTGVVPQGREPKLGTLAGIVAQAGVAVDDVLAVL